MFALVITGPPGAGKTEVLAALGDALVADAVHHVTIEVEALTSAYPALADDRWSEPVRALCALYRRFGYDLLLVTATVESQRDLDAVVAAIGADEHAVVRLEAEPPTLRRRIAEREPDGWPGLDGLLASADRLAGVVAGLDGIALALSTEKERAPAVAERIRAAFPERLGPGPVRRRANGISAPAGAPCPSARGGRGPAGSSRR